MPPAVLRYVGTMHLRKKWRGWDGVLVDRRGRILVEVEVTPRREAVLRSVIERALR